MEQNIAEERGTLLRILFPEGVPQLWCPPITHYQDDGSIAPARTEAHLAWMAQWVRGLLAAGSTSDGWELDQERHRVVTELAIKAATRHSYRILVGLLRPRHEQVVKEIASWTKTLCGEAVGSTAAKSLASQHMCGFAACAPTGGGLPEQTVKANLESMLQSGAPIALYQLPQVVGYEMSPEIIGELAARFSNFILFKDSSGRDSVANSRRIPADVFQFRGAEGHYIRWLVQQGGPYYGWLLSSANGFAEELHSMLHLLENGEVAVAEEKSIRLTTVMTELFQLAGSLPEGNAFSNANKAIDHHFAHGRRAGKAPLPRYSSGRVLPEDLIRKTGELLSTHGLLPTQGYLD